MADKYILAIDQGTTSSRAIIFNHEGQIVSVGQKEHEQIFPRAGWVEHNPIEVWDNVREVVAEALAKASLNKDTSVLTWKISYSGLTGPATAAHFHGPAMAGANAGVVLPFASATSPIEGTATLTAAQVADLTAGKWYANVHTAANKGGEIRGQVAK